MTDEELGSKISEIENLSNDVDNFPLPNLPYPLPSVLEPIRDDATGNYLNDLINIYQGELIRRGN